MENTELSGETFKKLLSENFPHFLFWWSDCQDRNVGL